MAFLWFLQDIRSPFLTALFRFFTLFGEEIPVVVVLCVLYWCIRKDLAYGASISFFVSALIVQGLKIILRIERPWVLDPAFMPVAEALATATGFSFPSGHTQAAASLFGYLGIASRKRWVRITSWVLVGMVALSRMYLGVHTPADVLAALAISLLIAVGTYWYLKKGLSDALLSGLLGALSLGVIIYATSLYSRDIIDIHYLSDCCKAAGGCIGCAVGLLWAKRAIPFHTGTSHLWQQGVKILIGLAGVLVIQSGLKALLGATLPIDILRYFLIALWALALYPLLFERLWGREKAPGALPSKEN